MKHEVKFRGNGCHDCGVRLTARNRSADGKLCAACAQMDQSIKDHIRDHREAGVEGADCCHCVMERVYGF